MVWNYILYFSISYIKLHIVYENVCEPLFKYLIQLIITTYHLEVFFELDLLLLT